MNHFGSDEGWRSWLGEQPPDVLIQIARVGWHTPETLYRSEVAREANAVGLYWRLTGIGKEALCKRS